MSTRRRGPLRVGARSAGRRPARRLPGAGGLYAQKPDAKLKLFFSDRPNDPAPCAFLPLRPNVLQNLYVYVQNLGDKDETVAVQLHVNAGPVEGAAASVKATAGRTLRPCRSASRRPPPTRRRRRPTGMPRRRSWS